MKDSKLGAWEQEKRKIITEITEIRRSLTAKNKLEELRRKALHTPLTEKESNEMAEALRFIENNPVDIKSLDKILSSSKKQFNSKLISGN